MSHNFILLYEYLLNILGLPLGPQSLNYLLSSSLQGFPAGSVVKNLPAIAGDAGDTGSMSGLGRSRVGNGNPLQHSCLENSMDRGTWQSTVLGLQRIGCD